MKLLLDTHVFLWMNDAPDKLSVKVREIFARGQNELFLSIATPWEIQIKQQIGKLAFEGTVDELLAPHMEDNSLRILPIELRHIMGLGSLAMHHRDPFDRMFIAQALTDGMGIVTADPLFGAYPVSVIW
jgi:PIN domain nuclease of toxin-antitoxin system